MNVCMYRPHAEKESSARYGPLILMFMINKIKQSKGIYKRAEGLKGNLMFQVFEKYLEIASF